jgi:hypothetical protein
MKGPGFLLFLALCAGCAADPQGPGGGCGTTNALVACVDRSEYAPGDPLALTVVNRGAVSARIDTCAALLVERTTIEFSPPVYHPARRCGPNPSPDDILAAAVEVKSGESRTVSLTVAPALPQGFYRVYAWLLDDSGALAAPDPVRSNEFDVFPSAGK